MTGIVAAIAIILIIGLVFVLKKNKPDQSKPETTSQPSPLKASPEEDYETILASLLNLNLMLRKDRFLDPDITLEIESIMDDLMVVIPAMMERYPGETLTYEIKKIGNTHLHKTVKEYLDLSEESRTNQFDTFKQTIDNLKDVANRSRDIVEKNETAEFKTMANFLSSKFSSS